jgi:hypothetical protein
MNTRKRRSQMISIRFSRDEYLAIKHLCSQHGVKMSDFCRNAVLKALSRMIDSNSSQPSEVDVLELLAAIKRLEQRLIMLENNTVQDA